MSSFITEASDILTMLKTMDYSTLKKMWHCKDSIAQLNYQRITVFKIFMPFGIKNKQTIFPKKPIAF